MTGRHQAQVPGHGGLATGGTEARGGVRLVDVHKVFGDGETGVRALDGVDLDLDPGSFTVVLGPSGSGKTTLLNVVGGIEQATSGTVLVAGEDLSGRSPVSLAGFRRAHIGFVFQFFNLVPTLTALENVEILCELTGVGDRARAAELIDRVGLSDRAEHFPAELSGGQQQRVAIARALVTDPDVLLADEPTGALDLDTGRQILGLLMDLRRSGRTVVVVTHNVSVAQIADTVVTVVDGRVQEVRHQEPAGSAEAVAW